MPVECSSLSLMQSHSISMNLNIAFEFHKIIIFINQNIEIFYSKKYRELLKKICICKNLNIYQISFNFKELFIFKLEKMIFLRKLV